MQKHALTTQRASETTVTKVTLTKHAIGVVRIRAGDEDKGSGVLIQILDGPTNGFRLGQVVTYAGGDYDCDRQERILPKLVRVQHRANELQVVKDEVAQGIQESMTFNPRRWR